MDREEVAVDFNKICRLCMCEESKMTSIFIEQSGAVPLPLRIMACVSIEVGKKFTIDRHTGLFVK